MKVLQRLYLTRLALIWLLCELAGAAQVRQADGQRVLTSWLRALAVPPIAVSAWVAEVGEDLVWGVKDQQRVVSEAQRDRRALDLYQTEVTLLREDLLALQTANRLRTATHSLAEGGLVARCTFRNLALGLMQLGVGLSSGVRTDTAVISEGGLIGRVILCDDRYSWVELITHPAAAVAVQTEDGSLHGLATGAGAGSLSVMYVPRAAELLRGVVLLTSGADGVYPAGLPVARVTNVREGEGVFLEVSAAPLARLEAVRMVLLLPGWPRASWPGSLQ